MSMYKNPARMSASQPAGKSAGCLSYSQDRQAVDSTFFQNKYDEQGVADSGQIYWIYWGPIGRAEAQKRLETL
jgi:hypothetical protein